MADCLRTAMIATLLVGLGATCLAAPAPERCDRHCLEGTVDRYLAAMLAHDPTRLAMSADVKYTENQDLVRMGEGIWRDADQISEYKIYAADPERGEVGFMGAVHAGSAWTMIALRLRVAAGRITEAEAVLPGRVASAGAFGFGDAAAHLGKPRPGLSESLAVADRRDRSVLVGAADLHYQGIERGNGDIVPFSEDCIKIENGTQLIRNPNYNFPAASPTGKKLPNFAAMGCRDQFNTHIWDTDTVTDRRYPIVDTERGLVMAFVMYNEYAKARCADVVDYGLVCPPVAVQPSTLVLVETFKVKAGDIQGVEAVFTVLPSLRPRGVW